MHKKYVRFKRGWNSRSERLETRPRGEPTEKRSGKAEIQNELLPLSRKYIPETNKAPPFFVEKIRCLKGRLGCRERRRQSSEKKGRAADSSGFAGDGIASDASKNSCPSDAGSFCTASLQQAQKGNGCTFVLRLVLRHCRWLARIFSKVRSAVPQNPSEQKSGSPEVQTEGQQGRCAYRRGRNDRGTEKATEK